MSKYVFETLEELQRVYPIHSVFSEQKVIHKVTCYNVYDFDAELIDELKKNSISLKKIGENVYERIYIEANIIFVDGYVCDGQYWYPAQRTLDVYKRINEHDIFHDKEVVRERESHYYRPGINMKVDYKPGALFNE